MKGKDIEKMAEKQNIKGLVKALTYKKDSDVPSKAAFALGQLKDPHAIQPLIDMLGQFNEYIRKRAADMLAELGETKWKEIIKGDDEDYIRLAKTNDPRIVGTLIYYGLNQINTNIKKETAIALGKFKDPRAVKPLLLMMDYSDQRDRWAAESALMELANDPCALESIINALDDKYALICANAMTILKEMVDNFWIETAPGIFPRIIKAFIKAQGNSNQYVANDAQKVLEKLKEEQWQLSRK